ncbi:MAG TPA: DUF3618 domain-containing protein [Solirubrobacteraceae bacterium]
MGQDESSGGTTVAGSRDPEQIRSEIDETRRELGDTVEALASKTDVKAQLQRKVETAKDKAQLGEKLQRAKDNPAAVAAIGIVFLGLIVRRMRHS